MSWTCPGRVLEVPAAGGSSLLTDVDAEGTGHRGKAILSRRDPANVEGEIRRGCRSIALDRRLKPSLSGRMKYTSSGEAA